MRQLYIQLTSAIFCLFCGSVAFCQPPGKQPFPPGGMPPFPSGSPSTFMLLNEKSVQTDLKLSTDQTKKLSAESAKQQKAMQATFKLQPEQRMQKMQETMKASDEAAEKLLTDTQKKRLKQIALQVQGSQAFANADVAKELKLTDDQQEKIKTVNESVGKQMAGLFQGKKLTPQAFEKQVTEFKKKANDQAKQVLTSEQTTTWSEMTGPVFRGQVRMMPSMGFGPPGFGPPPGFPPKQ
jgi:hypothetical protein